MLQLGVFVAEEVLKSQIPIGRWHWHALFCPGNFHSLLFVCHIIVPFYYTGVAQSNSYC